MQESDGPDAHGTDESPEEGEREDRPEVAEEVLLFEFVARVEDDRRQQEIEEQRMIERLQPSRHISIFPFS